MMSYEFDIAIFDDSSNKDSIDYYIISDQNHVSETRSHPHYSQLQCYDPVEGIPAVKYENLMMNNVEELDDEPLVIRCCIPKSRRGKVD